MTLAQNKTTQPNKILDLGKSSLAPPSLKVGSQIILIYKCGFSPTPSLPELSYPTTTLRRSDSVFCYLGVVYCMCTLYCCGWYQECKVQSGRVLKFQPCSEVPAVQLCGCHVERGNRRGSSAPPRRLVVSAARTTSIGPGPGPASKPGQGQLRSTCSYFGNEAVETRCYF